MTFVKFVVNFFHKKYYHLKLNIHHHSTTLLNCFFIFTDEIKKINEIYDIINDISTKCIKKCNTRYMIECFADFMDPHFSVHSHMNIDFFDNTKMEITNNTIIYFKNIEYISKKHYYKPTKSNITYLYYLIKDKYNGLVLIKSNSDSESTTSFSYLYDKIIQKTDYIINNNDIYDITKIAFFGDSVK